MMNISMPPKKRLFFLNSQDYHQWIAFGKNLLDTLTCKEIKTVPKSLELRHIIRLGRNIRSQKLSKERTCNSFLSDNLKVSLGRELAVLSVGVNIKKSGMSWICTTWAMDCKSDYTRKYKIKFQLLYFWIYYIYVNLIQFYDYYLLLCIFSKYL